MKLLWDSNAPWVGTGYGSQTKLILKALLELGHDPQCFCYWGLQGGRIEYDGYMCWPNSPFENWGNDVINAHIKNSKVDTVVTLIDLFVLQPEIWKKLAVPWIAWVPIDHEEIDGDTLQVLNIVDHPVAMSKFGFDQMIEAGVEPIGTIYHAVDTEVFKPLDREECRDSLGLDKDSYIIGMVMANKGDRKQFPAQLKAAKLWMDRHPEYDARIFLHTEMNGQMGGWNMRALVDKMGLSGKVHCTDDYFSTVVPVDDNQMATIFNSFDVLMNCSAGEGFGIPIIEAQACGVPVIAQNVTAMPELVHNGYCVESSNRYLAFTQGYQYNPSIDDMVVKLEAVYRMNDKSKNEAGRQWVEEHCSVPVIAAQWDELLETVANHPTPIRIRNTSIGVEEHEPWLVPFLPEGGSVALDIGANVGSWTETLFHKFETVIAFEPHPQAFKQLVSRIGIYEDRERAHLLEMALGKESGKTQLDIYADHAHTSSHSGEDFTAGRSNAVGETLEVDCGRLDDFDFSKPVDFVKLDVEGAEVEVIEGALEFIEKHKPNWIVEVHSAINRNKCVELLGKYYSDITYIAHPHDPTSGHGWLSVVRS